MISNNRNHATAQPGQRAQAFAVDDGDPDVDVYINEASGRISIPTRGGELLRSLGGFLASAARWAGRFWMSSCGSPASPRAL